MKWKEVLRRLLINRSLKSNLWFMLSIVTDKHYYDSDDWVALATVVQ
jgi:hypothetical protein